MERPLENYLDDVSVLTGEMLLFGMLAKIIHSEPHEAWLLPLLQDDVFAEAPFGMEQQHTRTGLEYLNRWVAMQDGKPVEDILEELSSDFLSLFIGPGMMLAPMWESVYFNDKHLLFQEQTMDVRHWYARFGVQIERLSFEPDDHIAFELSFLAHLASLSVKAGDRGDNEDVERFMEAQQEFCRQHLFKWGREWASLVVEHARTDFYRGIGYLTLGSLQALADLFCITLPAGAAR